MNLGIVKDKNMQEKFNSEQLEFINSGICDMKLIGIPGGGKTRCIIEHIRKNIRDGSFSSPKEYMIITFSRRARDDFLKKGRDSYRNLCTKFRFSRSYAFDRHNVRTIHSLSAYIMKEKEEGNCSVNTVVTRCRDYLAEGKTYDSSLNSIKMLYVDEAQDISKIQYDFILSFISRINCNIAFVGDPNQNIYQFQGGSDKYMRDHPGCKTINLRINYRSTQTLVNFFNYMMPVNSNNGTNNIINNKMISAKSDSDNNISQILSKPVVVAGNFNDISRHIVKTIKDFHGGYDNIAILSPVKLSRPRGRGGYSNIGLSFAVDLLEKSRIKYVCHYDDFDYDQSRGKTELIYKKNHLNLMTIHGSKGLEFDLVILLNFHQNYMGVTPTENEYNNEMYLWYVGITRAKSQLLMYKYRNSPVYFGLNNACIQTYNILPLCGGSKFTLPGEKSISAEIIQDKIKMSIDEIIGSMSEDNMMILEDSVNITFTTTKICDPYRFSKLREYSNLSQLYQNFIANMLQYLYLIKNGGKLSDLSAYIEAEKINSTAFLPAKYKRCFKKILSLFDCKNYLLVSAEDVDRILETPELMENLPTGSEELLTHILQCMQNLETNQKIFAIKNTLQYVDKESTDMIFEKLCENSGEIHIAKDCIFKLCLYVYQYNYERSSMWNKDISGYIADCSPIIHNLQCFIAKKMNSSDYVFKCRIEHDKIPIYGNVDIIKNRGKYIKLHFAEEEPSKHEMIKLLLKSYCENKNPQIEIWSISVGKKYKIAYKNIEFGPVMTFTNIIGKKFDSISLIVALDMDFSSCEPEISGYSVASNDPNFTVTYEDLRETLNPVESLRTFFRRILDFCNDYSLIIHNENDIVTQLFDKNNIKPSCKNTVCISEIMSKKYNRDFTDYDIAEMYKVIKNVAVKNEHSSRQTAQLMRELLSE